jgi:hypothetical protein
MKLDTLKTRARFAILATIAAMIPFATQGSAHAAGPNLLPNASFEASVLEPSGVPPYTSPQGMLPTGYAFEGLAGLFDHNGSQAHTGNRLIGISVPASGKDDLCAGAPAPCQKNPTREVKDAAAPYVSITPFWRTLMPVPVTAGKTYKLSVWTRQTLATVLTGAITQVRWTDASGVPIGAVSKGPACIQGDAVHPLCTNADQSAWKLISGDVKAPAGAGGAIVMFGAQDDDWISQICFDDAYFGTA